MSTETHDYNRGDAARLTFEAHGLTPEKLRESWKSESPVSLTF